LYLMFELKYFIVSLNVVYDCLQFHLNTYNLMVFIIACSSTVPPVFEYHFSLKS
jgi:hypothetical protein